MPQLIVNSYAFTSDSSESTDSVILSLQTLCNSDDSSDCLSTISSIDIDSDCGDLSEADFLSIFSER